MAEDLNSRTKFSTKGANLSKMQQLYLSFIRPLKPECGLTGDHTQSEIIDALHNSCYQLFSFKQQCIELVDYYVPLFFLEIASVQPGNSAKGSTSVNLQRFLHKLKKTAVAFAKILFQPYWLSE
ncbi:Saposin-like [Sesbania bispinosa]|nr:Saposin-like [Sesbania bispinosa]